MSNNHCFFNGQIISFSEAKMSLNDLGLWRGYGVFDFARTYQGQPFKLIEHLQRLQKSAEFVRLNLPLSLSAIEEIIEELLFMRENPGMESGIRLVLTGGYTDNGTLPAGGPNFLITIENLPKLDPKDYKEGVKVITYEHLREFAEVKTTNYLPIYITQSAMQEAGAKDVLYCKNGLISECTRNNFFAIKNKKLITPKNGILKGITRQIIMDLGQQIFEKVEERDFHYDELKIMDEAFKTGTNLEVMPIVAVDNQLIGQGKVGFFTQEVMKAYADYTGK
jgi:branched-subunit amino acid aminotransferase/4-amino-4-deoxychorismate lyase